MTTIKKTIQRQRGKRFIVINAELRTDDPRGLSDGFSITADLYEPRGNRSGKLRYEQGREPDSCGCQHDEIMLFAPELAPLIEVHLSDPNGVPPVANGWYFYSGKARQWEESRGEAYSNREGLSDQERAARTLNIPAGDLPDGMDKAQFEAFAESLRPRWAEQAATARALLETL